MVQDENPKKPAPKTQSIGQLVQKLCLLVAALAVVGIGLVAFHYVYDAVFTGTGNSTKEQGLPKLEPAQVLVPTDVQKFVDSHGPWLPTSESEGLRAQTGVRNLALLKANGLAYSAKSVLFDGKSPWSASTTPPQITGVAVRGTVLEIRTQKGNTYTLNVTQPFMVEGELSRVYVVDRANKLWVASPANLNFVDAAQVADLSIPANQNLAISIGN